MKCGIDSCTVAMPGNATIHGTLPRHQANNIITLAIMSMTNCRPIHTNNAKTELRAEWRYRDGWGVLACADGFNGNVKDNRWKFPLHWGVMLMIMKPTAIG